MTTCVGAWGAPFTLLPRGARIRKYVLRKPKKGEGAPTQSTLKFGTLKLEFELRRSWLAQGRGQWLRDDGPARKET